ncbi:MAG: TonB-dependent receptor [Microscillaceae bacterium]|nr:TonB-dependent receptor [Microscillaceae bacterium]MDW8461955.1 TonB-dependent receptor [Cytophagales bacterium]
MLKFYFTSLLIGLTTYFTFAQFTLKGTVKDSLTQENLVGAVVMLTNTFKATATQTDGSFLLTGLKPGKYSLKVSFLGYKTATQEIQISENQEIVILLAKNTFLADELVVLATRANQKSAVAYTEVSQEEIAKQNLGQDLPILLNFTPSVVTTSDAGAGIGYTGIRIRGSDGTRINVTINGIPLNDAESQGVFWVNMPDFASSVSSVQIQRGVGTSTNGAGAFGATINIQTNQLNEKSYTEVNNSYGSFNTWKHTLMAGTGLIDNKFTLDARLSRITSDGFIDRASSELKSFYTSGAYYGKKSLLRLNIFSGKEKTYQAWNGVPEAKLRGDLQGIRAYIDRNGLDTEDANNLLTANNRTYNAYLYDNQTDNYQQDHYQLFYTYEISPKLNANIALHYTYGRGYFEQYRKNDDFATYNLTPLTIGNTTISQTDVIRRLWLDNHFYGTVYSLNYQSNLWNITFGGGANTYQGKHFGELIWARFASNSQIRQRYYDNDATKNDINNFIKIAYQITPKLNILVDLQHRNVFYSFLGFGRQGQNVQQSADLHFFNPKFGATYQLNTNQNLYAYFGIAHREPNREDFTQSTPDSRPKAEQLQNWELGYKLQANQIAFNANLYYMNYRNQLVLTGQVNDVGNYVRTNIPQSYRAGIELELGLKLNNRFTWNANATFSQNKIQNFEEFIDDFDNGGQVKQTYSQTDIAFSPNVICGSQLEYKPLPNLSLALLSKYVSEQFLDNTSNPNRKLNAFFTNDLRFIYQLKPKFCKTLTMSLLVNNIFNQLYEPNGYTFGYIAGGERITENFYYPQAGTNFLVGLGIRF